MPRGQLHVTMAILDDTSTFSAEKAGKMVGVGERLVAEPSQVIFDRVVGNGRATVLIASEAVPGLTRLHRQLALAVAASGLPLRKGWQFKPHLTLVRHMAIPADEGIDPVSWRAGEIALVHSLVGWGEHRLLGRWPLGCG